MSMSAAGWRNQYGGISKMAKMGGISMA